VLDIITLGEVLVDLTQTGVSPAGILQYAANPGGAPANVAVAAARLGARTGFIGKVGADAFGAMLRRTLEENSVDTAGLVDTSDIPTTLAVVSVGETGERSFSFYRTPGADTMLTAAEAKSALVGRKCKFLHLGSLSLTAEPARSASLEAIMCAREQGSLISYDPNYRESLWPDRDTAIRWMLEPIDRADVLKVSDEELPLLTGVGDLETGTKVLRDLGAKLVLVTLGGSGACYRMGNDFGMVPGVPVKVADTNGAGDTFFGAVLSRLCARGEQPLEELTVLELEEILSFANRAAAKTCSRSGAIPAMPTWEEMQNGE